MFSFLSRLVSVFYFGFLGAEIYLSWGTNAAGAWAVALVWCGLYTLGNSSYGKLRSITHAYDHMVDELLVISNALVKHVEFQQDLITKYDRFQKAGTEEKEGTEAEA